MLLLTLIFASLSLGFNDYSTNGPYQTETSQTYSFRAPSYTKCSSLIFNYCSVKAEVTYPVDGQGPFPLIIYSNGFNQNMKDYRSYANHAASWGYAVVRWNPDEGLFGGITHAGRGNVASYLIDWAFEQSADPSSRLFGKIDKNRPVIQGGHSLGGKTSLLAAIVDARIQGIVLMDPVDCPPPFTNYDEDYPNSIEMMGQTKAAGVFIGAELGDIGELVPCAPVACNYQRYYANATAPAWEVMITQTGHSQWLDGARSGGRGGCGSGPQKTDIVQMISRTILVAWAQYKVYNEDISYWTKEWIQEMKVSGYVDYQLK